MKTIRLGTLTLAAAMIGFTPSCGFHSARPDWVESCGHGTGEVRDEAACVGRTPESLAGADEDYFADMDYGVSKDGAKVAKLLQPYLKDITPEAAKQAVAKGRNNWIVWTGGNDRFWDALNVNSVGSFDMLKVLSNHPGLKFSRDSRWNYLGVINEPCFEKNVDSSGKAVGRADRFGLYLDVRKPGCAADPFENETKYPGVKIGARGATVPVGSYYGYGTGIVGLRLFPNPAFDEAAKKHWDPERYYTDPNYYNDKNLVRPYRVGMSCGFCHVGPNPTNPPKDPENPTWANLNSNSGAQYLWFDRVFAYQADPTSFATQTLATLRPGALDTSLISTDYINNPRTQNAIYNLGARMALAKRLGKEELVGPERNNKQFNDFLHSGPLTEFFHGPGAAFAPRVLKDGSDSVGALGALNRVYVNIGLFSEEWMEHFKPLVGGTKFTPFPIAAAQKNSSYWKANEAQTPDLALFFLAATPPDLLQNAPGGKEYLKLDAGELNRGKEVFAERCGRCHSSKFPEKTYTFFPDNGCVGPDYLNCWNRYWEWTKTSEYKKAMTKIVLAKDFLDNNYMSNELRVPVTLTETNICASLATNALAGDIWDNFSSSTYKTLPSVGEVMIHDPVSRAPISYTMPAGGRGYIRPPSLISLWSTAPFLLNNSLGKFYPSGSVADRLKSFDISIEQLLWPEKRECQTYFEQGEHGYADAASSTATEPYGYAKRAGYTQDQYASSSDKQCADRRYKTKNGREVPGIIDRTYSTSFLNVPDGYLPAVLKPLAGADNVLSIGPIPKGTPVNLISNIDLERKGDIVKDVLVTLIADLKKVKGLPADAGEAAQRKVFANAVQPLLSVSKCPDLVVNRGHYFGTDYFGEEPGLSDKDKRALISFLKTF